jgi:hypothetical protein
MSARFKFGDIIENGWAGDSNPTKRGVYLWSFTRTGRMNPGKHVKVLHDDGRTGELRIADDDKMTVVGTIFDERDAALAAKDAEISELRAKLFPYADATEISGISWDGKYLIGDKKSIAFFHEMKNRGEQIDVYKRAYDQNVAAKDAEIERLRAICVDTQMLAFKWQEAHDCLKAGLPYSFPSPTDLPEAIAAKDAEIAKLREALTPFSTFAGIVFARNFENTDPVDTMRDVDGSKVTLFASDYFAARAALKGDAA